MSEPDNDDDRDLAAFLAGRSTVSEAWRAAGEGDHPSAALDAAILAAAASVGPKAAPVPGSRHRRWRLPVGLAASLLVGIGVLREVERDPLAQRAAYGTAAVPAAAMVASPPVPTTAEASPSMADHEAVRERAGTAARRQARVAMAEAETELRMRETQKAQQAPPPVARGLASAPSSLPESPARASAPAPAEALTSPAPPASEAVEGFAAAPEAAAAADAAAAEVAVPKRRASGFAAAAGAAGHETPSGDYRGLRFGMATPDDARHRHGEPAFVQEDDSGDATLLGYTRSVDARGRLVLRFAGAKRRLVEATVVLDPPLPIVDVRRDDGLDTAGQCPDGEPEPVDKGESGTLEWPSRGIVLWLGDADQVLSIIHRPPCRQASGATR
jgi:hypothetical protein